LLKKEKKCRAEIAAEGGTMYAAILQANKLSEDMHSVNLRLFFFKKF
jgi:hypothetical protein